MTPFGVKKKCGLTNETILVPCGKCPDCLKRLASSWSFRLMQEEKISSSAYFLTLTYDTTTVPITPNGFMNLCKRDLQLFFKKLRLKNDEKLKYFVVGEYGGRTRRPHYHLLLFNAILETVQPAWDKGSIHYGLVTGASVGYTLKYMMKPSKVPMHKNDDRQREFRLMSKGLGVSYMSEAMYNWHMQDVVSRVYCTLADGKKIAMPRYYKDKIYTDEERKLIAFYGQLAAEEQLQKNLAIHGDDFYSKKFAHDKAEFSKMYKQAVMNRTKI